MKRQIFFIITMLIMPCSWSFVAAQSNGSLTDYMGSRAKPVTITQWIKTKTTGGSNSLTKYRSPTKLFKEGNIFAEHYVTAMRRELDVMGDTIIDYAQSVIATQAKTKPGGSDTTQCGGLTGLDVAALLSSSAIFQERMSVYPMIANEQPSDEILEAACIKRIACKGDTFAKTHSSLTASQRKRPVCSDALATQVLSLFDLRLPQYNFDFINQYNNIFIDGSGANAPFELSEDMRIIAEHHFENLVSMPDTTDNGKLDQISKAQITYVPDQLIASTQQLLTALQIQTAVDPLQDAQIASLKNQLTTVSSSSVTVPTASTLNVCIDPSLSATDSRAVLEQLAQATQLAQEYNNSFNTDQSLNDVIVGRISPEDILVQDPRVDPVLLDTNPLGAAIAGIEQTTEAQLGGGSGPAPDIINALGGGAEMASLQQCVSSCDQQYQKDNDSACVQTCKAQGQIGGFLNQRACNQKCYNAKIACQAACLCDFKGGGTTPAAGEVKKLHEMFELRWCVIPTNKLRNAVDSSCIRVDPKTGILKGPSIACLLDQTIEQGNYNRESGKGGLRINPKERYQLPSKFDLKTMIRFPVMVVNSPLSNDTAKKSDITKSLNKQQYEYTSQLTSKLVNSQVAGKVQINIESFIQGQIKLWQEIETAATTVQAIVSSK